MDVSDFRQGSGVVQAQVLTAELKGCLPSITHSLILGWFILLFRGLLLLLNGHPTSPLHSL